MTIAPERPTLEDPFAQEVDAEDPFASPDDVKGGGSFRPVPKPEDYAGRLVAMIPRKFRNDAPIPEQFQQAGGPTVRDEYTVDLYILDGGELKFWANVKQEGSEDRELKEIIVPADEIPAGWEGVWIVQSALIGQLRKVDGTRRPILLGRMRRGPQAKDRGKKTFDSIQAEWDAYAARGMKGEKPRFSWQVDVAISPEDRAVALEWWRKAGITL
ncbi:MAG TPA: hypothetical protein VFU47_14280 [Armatimonadota bacterium]|nr:hypothetical protein [Armatimonadota bacterium]